jgi:hypothetical protein
MHTLRFGRKLSVPSTIAVKHQRRKLMAEDQVIRAAAEARIESTDIPQINVGPARRSGAWVCYENLEDSESRTAEAERAPLSDIDGRTFIDRQDRRTTTWRCGATTTP